MAYFFAHTDDRDPRDSDPVWVVVFNGAQICEPTTKARARAAWYQFKLGGAL